MNKWKKIEEVLDNIKSLDNNYPNSPIKPKSFLVSKIMEATKEEEEYINEEAMAERGKKLRMKDKLLDIRKKLRDKKDYKLADEIRDFLERMGYTIKDKK